MYLHEIKAVSAKRKRKRVGRGTGSGTGKTCGRGAKGQRSRSGSFGSAFFAGGQTPFFRRLPKRGFSSQAHDTAIVNLEDLNRFEDGSTVDIEVLRTAGLVRRRPRKVKILGHGDLRKRLTVKASGFSETAAKAIAGAGGETQRI